MKMIVGGKEISREKTLEVLYPYTGEVIDTVPEASFEDVDKAISLAVEGKRIMKNTPIYKRVEILNKVSEIILQKVNELTKSLVLEVGKTIREARAEVLRTAEIFKYAAEEARRIHGETLPFDSVKGSEMKKGFFIREPVGIVGAIVPFNVPLALAAHKIAPAIAAGNAVILKPTTQAPLNGIILGRILLEAGMPPEALSVLTGRGNTVGTAIVKDPRIRVITFTGSVDVGKEIMKNAGIKKVALELGSNSALVIMNSANIEKAVKATVSGGFSLAGQVCISVQRVFVQEDVFEDYINRLIEEVKKIKYGDPMNEKIDMGPVIDESNAKRIVEWINEAKELGGKIVIGGQRDYTMVEPTVVVNVPLNAKIMEKELFGPAVAVRKIHDLDEAIKLVNKSRYGLQAGIFTERLEEAFRFAECVEVGGVMINEGPRYRADFMPYGGYKDSGIGREGIKYAIEEMTEIKVVCFDLRRE